MNLDKLFNPKSVAVIGASPEKTKVGYAILSNLLKSVGRRIYPVNPAYSEVLGEQCYPSVLEIRGEIELAVIAVRADLVPQVLADCGRKKVPFAIIISAGFKEIGRKGEILEEKVRKIAKQRKITLLGPNCLGIMNSRGDLNISFATQKPLGGGIAFLSQSGAMGTALLDWASSQGIGFSKFISLGNEAGLTELEFLEYLMGDTDTKAVLVYLEKVSDGRKFIELTSKLAAKKPVVLLKAGRSGKGRAAALSHTGSLAPEDAVFAAACKQGRVIMVESLREFFNFAKLFRMGILKPLRRLAVLTNGGGPSVVAADLIDLSHSLELVEFGRETENALRKVLPPMAAVGNPVDIIGDALPDRYDAALKILTEEKGIDGLIVMLTPQMMTEAEATARLLVRYSKKKPIIPVFIGGAAAREGVTVLRENGLVNFHFPDMAIEALDALAQGAKKKVSTTLPQKTTTPLKMTNFSRTSKILQRYGIKIEGALVRKKKELGKIFTELKGRPAAVKIVSPDIVHKTDAGAVKLNVKDASGAEMAWDAMLKSICRKNRGAKIEGALIQPIVKGKEVIIGMKRDPVFGPVIVFGWGGILVEALKDTTMRIAPVSPKEAREMIEEIRGYKILAGLRGEKPVNINALVKIIVAISRISLAHPEIKEIDLNPVMINKKTATAVDARMTTN